MASASHTKKVLGSGKERKKAELPIVRDRKGWKEYAAQNGVLFQYFHWNLPADGTLWKELAQRAPELAKAGITNVWIPPAYKGSGGANEVGYGVYDLFDLGEFDQKGTVRTKYGTKDELLAAIKSIHDAGMTVFADIVLNHRDGGDEEETVPVREVAWDNRTKTITDKFDIQSFTKFTFPARAGKYSTMEWHWGHFTGCSYNSEAQNTEHLYVFGDKQFSGEVSPEFGSYDYLMGVDVDYYNDEVRGETKYWGEWFLKETGVDGLRLDAVKHISHSWIPEWLDYLRGATKRELFTVGEYLSRNVDDLLDYLDTVEGRMSLFDFALHQNFHEASVSGAGMYPMNCLLDDTLLQHAPDKAVTFADNHDTQPGQALEPPVEAWFKPHAYAIMLLRQQGFPCIFYADYYGAEYDANGNKVLLPSHKFLIDRFLEARRVAGWGDQHDYFDHPRTVGWVRTGDAKHPRAMAVVMTNGTDGFKNMRVYKPKATFADITEHIKTTVETDDNGCADFACLAGKVSVWVEVEKNA